MTTSPVDHVFDPLRFTQDALATRLIDQHQASLRFLAGESSWLYPDGRGGWWCEPRQLVLECARAVAREASAEIIALVPGTKGAKLAARVSSAAFVRGIERLARADRRVWIDDTELYGGRRGRARGDFF